MNGEGREKKERACVILRSAHADESLRVRTENVNERHLQLFQLTHSTLTSFFHMCVCGQREAELKYKLYCAILIKLTQNLQKNVLYILYLFLCFCLLR